jgi:hypothetical protein
MTKQKETHMNPTPGIRKELTDRGYLAHHDFPGRPDDTFQLSPTPDSV